MLVQIRFKFVETFSFIDYYGHIYLYTQGRG